MNQRLVCLASTLASTIPSLLILALDLLFGVYSHSSIWASTRLAWRAPNLWPTPFAIITSVTKILVKRNRLGHEGATILCNALRKSKVTKVRELDLSMNDIGPEGAKAVAAMAAVVAPITSVC